MFWQRCCAIVPSTAVVWPVCCGIVPHSRCRVAVLRGVLSKADGARCRSVRCRRARRYVNRRRAELSPLRGRRVEEATLCEESLSKHGRVRASVDRVRPPGRRSGVNLRRVACSGRRLRGGGPWPHRSSDTPVTRSAAGLVGQYVRENRRLGRDPRVYLLSNRAAGLAARVSAH